MDAIEGDERMGRRLLRVLAAVLVLVAVGTWLVLGASLGWTKTSVPVQRTDDVTGITVQDYRRGFRPGVDFLGAAALGALVLIAGSFLLRKPQTDN
ncbi:MAG TPA: hypothetical protein VMU04_11485 [Candidatus Acidoferrum sp.]|nr:hypothetical protein [Candidatus Acidoferrum sp.]